MDTWYVCSDVHDDTQAVNAFAGYAQAQGAHRLLVLGDFALRPYNASDLEKLVKTRDVPGFLDARKVHSDAVLQEMKNILSASGIHYNVIPGNYDGRLDGVFGAADLHNKSATFGEAKVFGYGGADAFPEHIALLVNLGERLGREEIVNFDHRELYDALSREQPAVGLIHNPPFQLCDDMYNGQHVGTRATTQHIVDHSPKLILSGHIHEAGPNGNNPNGTRGIAAYDNPQTGKKTVVLNPGNLGRFELIHPHTLEPMRAFDYGTFIHVDVEPDGTPKKVVQYTVQTNNRGVGQVRTLAEVVL